MRLNFTVQRYIPELDITPHPEDYRVEVSRGMTVLEALIRIKNEQDGTLSLRYSCRSAICGSCAMEINGTEKLACRTSVRQELQRHDQIVIAPLKNLPIIKDLVVDMSHFWEKLRVVSPWLHGKTERETGEGEATRTEPTLSRDSYQFHNVDACIMCGACVAACTTHEVSPGFFGPAALAKAARFVSDPREPAAAKRQRLMDLQGEHGIWDCTRCNFCVQVCPKDVKPMEAIIRLRRASIDEGLPATGGSRHITGFCEIVKHEGRLNEAIMPLKVVGFNLKRLFQLIPLGIRMLLKGKVPSPIGQPIPGIGQIRAIFSSARRSAGRP